MIKKSHTCPFALYIAVRKAGKSESRKVRKSESPEVRKSESPEVGKSGSRKVRKSGSPKVGKSESRKVRKSESPEVRKSESRKVGKSGSRKVRKSGSPGDAATDVRQPADNFSCTEVSAINFSKRQIPGTVSYLRYFSKKVYKLKPGLPDASSKSPANFFLSISAIRLCCIICQARSVLRSFLRLF